MTTAKQPNGARGRPSPLSRQSRPSRGAPPAAGPAASGTATGHGCRSRRRRRGPRRLTPPAACCTPPRTDCRTALIDAIIGSSWPNRVLSALCLWLCTAACRPDRRPSIISRSTISYVYLFSTDITYSVCRKLRLAHYSQQPHDRQVRECQSMMTPLLRGREPRPRALASRARGRAWHRALNSGVVCERCEPTGPGGPMPVKCHARDPHT